MTGPLRVYRGPDGRPVTVFDPEVECRECGDVCRASKMAECDPRDSYGADYLCAGCCEEARREAERPRECRECNQPMTPEEILGHGTLCDGCASWWNSIETAIDDRREATDAR